MAGITFKDVPGLISSPKAAKSPDSDVSPRTNLTKIPTDYFTAGPGQKQSPQASPGTTTPLPPLATASSGASTTTLTSTSNSAEDGLDGLRQTSNASSSSRPGIASRKSSTASVTFRPPRNPSLPQGLHRKTDIKTRLREASPEPVK
ncbi:hypothetical protein QBC40DRAFT_288861 [Triangularia verruculosa]|uniref:Uncharacterized protein n=1 Tax=Triangularia verruculosa TaxID=2587418 RepID=A0AAN6XD16_9PEZI|nr:hypothetical protein QBC40DRAFT_288861 [Triangularia verruculosa]